MKSFFIQWLPYVLFVLLAISFVKTMVDTYKATEQVLSLRQDVQVLEDENHELTLEQGYRNTQDFSEEEARDKLNMIHPGDTVIVFNSPTKSSEILVDDQNVGNSHIAPISQWQHLLFPAW
ncbi:septum formation initiator family protein [candidate division WWE3 bacterium]|nr:septum formation initiator family protein [candidate division WWE3 bacterium]